jgi:hypothetical protein
MKAGTGNASCPDSTVNAAVAAFTFQPPAADAALGDL